MKEFIYDFEKMPFTDEEREITKKVIGADFTAELGFNGSAFVWSNESDEYFYNSKELLLEEVYRTYEEYKKEGIFEEEDAPKNDPWFEVLADRVALEEEKEATHKQILTNAIKDFKKWVYTHSDAEIAGDITFRAQNVADTYNCYKAVRQRLGYARAELENYKKTMNL